MLTIIAWITVGHSVDLAVIAMVSAVALFPLRIVGWKDVQDYVNWGVLLMYGGAVALGSALTQTRAMVWLAQQVISADASPVAIWW